MKPKNLLKKTAAAALALTMTCAAAPARAAVGDIAETIYTTDILTRVNGRDINSFCVDGETLIAMEDLRDYGFTVTYDDSIRTLFVNQTAETPRDNMPEIVRGKVGGTAGCTYETDITVLFNGTEVKAYAIDGRMAAKVEDLGGTTAEGGYEFGMRHTYDDSQRLLCLDTAPTVPKDKQIADFTDPADKFNWHHDATYRGSDFDLVVCSSSGTSHGTYRYYRQFTDSGRSSELGQVFYKYGFNGQWGVTHIEVTEMKDDTLYFTGYRNDGREGSYSMDLKSYIITPVSETAPDVPAFSAPESPAGKAAVSPSFDVFIDGVPVRAMVVQNRAYADIDTLKAFGFEETFSNDSMIVLIKNGAGTKDAPKPLPPGTEIGTADAAAPKAVYINGAGVECLSVDGEPVVRLDNLRITPFENYDISCGIESEWDGALRVDTSMDGFPDYETQLERVYTTYDNMPNVAKEYLYKGSDRTIIGFNFNSLGTVELFMVCSNGLAVPVARLMSAYGITPANDPEVSSDGRYLTVTDQTDGKRRHFDLINLTPAD